MARLRCCTGASTCALPFAAGVLRCGWRSQSSSAAAPPIRRRRNAIGGEGVALTPLRCPGGPRVKAEGLKHLFKVPHAGYLAKYDQRFILNLKLTHQIVSHLSRTTLKTHDKLLIELGPGTGALTRSLLTRPCIAVLGVEADERFNAHLEQIRQYTDGKFQWVNADVLRVKELELLHSVFPSFVEQHRRRPAASHADAGEEGGAAAGNADDGGEGYEGAPLRNARRERILRRRFGKFAGFNHDTARDGGHSRDAGNSSGSGSSGSAAAFAVTDRWWSDGDAKVEVVANLPFDVITELLMRYAVDCSRRQNLFVFGRVPLHIFTQKEIAERIIAPAGSIHFSRLSVMCQCFFHVQVRQTFREMTYYPKTEVLGAMLTLQPRAVSLVPAMDAATLMHFTDLLMKPGHRGMTVYKALVKCVPAEVAQYMLQELRVDGALTVLDMTAEEICKLAQLWRRFLEASSQQQQPRDETTKSEAAGGNVE
ncbi:putative rRNA dimethyltransferase [Trypanosoma rangeli]|uniref:rRNA adenine N(6)-methyltransferase n=1 Tax=Trypanosoma rangeli TaxID=5698 RepID=A0A3R7NNC2_TRYRA|nr:putative rRNA dimethyltransferase [Trypanosoma rangeli]RNF05187.1 putative rRNA dimethyltransferase [Trypanosoma rangeli]|eukprot:RNF05187.1 putative rRNA dimethyltransferase [Trypanosoma rangeli]